MSSTLTRTQVQQEKIISYEDWMQQTRAGVTKPRSAELRQVDLALKNYHQKRDGAAFEALDAAFEAWWNANADGANSIRNRQGAVTRLNDALLAYAAREASGKAAMVQARADIARMQRPAGFLAEVKGGRKKFDKGALTGKFAKTGLAKVVGDPNQDYVFYEGFEGGNLTRAQEAWKQALLAAEKAAMGMKIAAANMSVANNPEKKRYEKWFGAATADEVTQMSTKADEMLRSMRMRPHTFVLRKDQILHLIDGVDPLGSTTASDFSDCYGYVWSGSGNHTGKGMRIVLCNTFLTDPCIYTGGAATVYHEVTHKVLGTSDKTLSGVTTYGISACKALALADPVSARNIADSWCYYAVSFLKPI